MKEVKEYYNSGKLRAVKVYENGKLMEKKRYYEKSGKFIDVWRRDEEINCVIKDEFGN
ncbi:hypothetical protein F7642_12565 [Tenacibaculum finnmarkense genomovar ulcerans]|uniref:hypothetical protein n=1 Tax=Tenacibaculum finnmarkense TaxID=2781243 RepID=UPI00187BC053|nr:hypothetical protein [Tenacibaculum finnmarkense]MBE7635156.1 hypothetical protein [Tenacibaculum finnmarkense genomovar ulcerans]MBE7646754.1 hypothetical protein [Tenacibaculum finnmarkense genomovar ulcerans]MBE7689047.1 hypothetical protein [Tenacibaculum finnmarkense genomovar ulcerans]